MQVKIKFNTHNFGELVTGITKSELTEIQKNKLEELSLKIKLTEKQSEELSALRTKRDAPAQLSETGKKLVEKMFRANVRNTNDLFMDSCQTRKGNDIENHSIKRIAKVNGWGICVKSDIVLEDEYGIGHPDVLKAGKLGYDAKSSFTDSSFPLFQKDLKETNYIWQAKRYAMMAGLDHWFVCYSLENTPEPIVISEAWKLWKKGMNDGSPDEDFINEVRKMHTFDHLEDWERVKTFRIELTEQDKETVKTAWKLGNDYYNELLESYNSKRSENIKLKKI